MSQRAILFPGQGAQAVGMGRELAESNSACRELFDRASAVLGYDLADICFNGPIEKLTISAHAQPAIFVHSVAAWTAWKQAQPDWTFSCAAGLSSGEWTALHLAGVVGYEETLKILEARGRFMTEACTASPGGMLSALGATAEQLEKLCAETGLEQANLNSPEQTVLSGPVEGVDKAESLASSLGIRRVIRLNVAGAFHSTLMRPAAAKLEAELGRIEFRAPSFPVLSNVTALPHGTPDDIRALMVRQVYSSVRWYQGIDWMKAQGVSEYLECGPGKVLTGLVKRIDKGARLHSIQDPSGLEWK
ncbi:MAG: ACP S-malonyltransferase [Kiritimatiellae bacterium]|nr:ACP S-malonyltransferase [Kiritimatiellia bacterium]MCO5062022.1 ACP S-malonyltransferase [Kiritimatiellia bacterium]